MFQRYFVHKSRRYGWCNTIKHCGKEVMFGDYFGEWAVFHSCGSLALCIISGSLYSYTQNILFWVLAAFLGVYGWGCSFYYFKKNTAVTCRFCSRDYEEAQEFVFCAREKYGLPADSFDLRSEDGWWMVYLRRKTTEHRISDEYGAEVFNER